MGGKAQAGRKSLYFLIKQVGGQEGEGGSGWQQMVVGNGQAGGGRLFLKFIFANLNRWGVSLN